MHLTLDSALAKPLYLQLRDQIREMMVAGALNPGDRLEPTRELAKRLGVHRTTVSNAYADLEAEGLIHGTVGRGTFVAPRASAVRGAGAAARRSGDDLFWDRFFAEESPDDSLGRLMASALDPGVISFASTRVPDELSAASLVRKAADAVLRAQGPDLLQYGSSDGYPRLKRYLQARFKREGIEAGLDEILITNGSQQSLDLVRRALVLPGDAVVCEIPTYTGFWSVFESAGVRLIGVPVGKTGMDLDVLAAVLEQSKVKLLLVSPNFQNPTGRTMPLEARRRVLDLAVRYQVPVVEDDIGALRYRGQDLPSLKSLDPAGLVVYLSSFSKVGFPGLRVGWVIAPRRAIERLQWAKQRADLHTNLLGQAVLEELGRRGWLDRLIRRSREVYAHKLEVLRRAIGRHFPPEAHIDYPDGGMFVWVELPEGLDAADLLVKARDRQVIFAPSRYFYFQNPKHNAFRLCFTALSDRQIEEGIGALGELLRAEIEKERTGSKGSPMGSAVALV